MKRPVDELGLEVVMGHWYWAKGRTGKVLGVGKFVTHIGNGELHFYLLESGYSPESFTSYVKAVVPESMLESGPHPNEPRETLTVIFRDDAPMIHCGDSPIYRSLQIELTAQQTAKLKPLHNEEFLSKCFIEPKMAF